MIQHTERGKSFFPEVKFWNRTQSADGFAFDPNFRTFECYRALGCRHLTVIETIMSGVFDMTLPFGFLGYDGIQLLLGQALRLGRLLTHLTLECESAKVCVFPSVNRRRTDLCSPGCSWQSCVRF